MRPHLRLLVAVLVYITLDVSVPSIPGAFVFDANESIDSVQMGRSRATVDVAAVLPPARATTIAAAPTRAATRPSMRPVRAAAVMRHRSDDPAKEPPEPASPSEDPH